YPIAVIERLFPSILCRTQSPSIHLTFDDGPHPETTPVVLDILKQYGIKATFFLNGEHIDRYPELARRIADEGHSAENHGYTHRNLFWCSAAVVRNELLKTNDAIMQHTRSTPKFFRPPFGFFRNETLNIAAQCSLKPVLWSFDSKDYLHKKYTFDRSLARQEFKGGDILLFHDNEFTSGSAGQTVSTLLDLLLKRHYTFAALEG
ncbi:MAG: polysaccharide deacetylase family protein, partial [Bacteroidota bacterium]